MKKKKINKSVKVVSPKAPVWHLTEEDVLVIGKKPATIPTRTPHDVLAKEAADWDSRRLIPATFEDAPDAVPAQLTDEEYCLWKKQYDAGQARPKIVKKTTWCCNSTPIQIRGKLILEECPPEYKREWVPVMVVLCPCGKQMFGQEYDYVLSL